MVIRTATDSDLKILREFAIQTFTDSFGEQNAEANMAAYVAEAFSPDQIQFELNEPNTVFFLAILEDELVGYARIRDNQKEIQDEQALELQRIYAASQMIGIGIGKALLNHCISYAIRNEKKSIWLGVWEKNFRAIEFYEKNGFEKFGQHEFLLGTDSQTDILMKKNLK